MHFLNIEVYCRKELSPFGITIYSQLIVSSNPQFLCENQVNFPYPSAQKWKGLRPAMTPAFTSSKMKIMFNIMEECSRQFSSYFINQETDVIDVELKDIFTRYTNDVIASTTFGVQVDSLRDRDNEFYRMGKAFANFDGTAIFKVFFYSVFTTPMKVTFKFIIENIFIRVV